MTIAADPLALHHSTSISKQSLLKYLPNLSLVTGSLESLYFWNLTFGAFEPRINDPLGP